MRAGGSCAGEWAVPFPAVPRHGRSVAVAWTVLSAQDRQASLGHPEQLLLGHGVSLVGDPKYQPSPSVPDTWLTYTPRPGRSLWAGSDGARAIAWSGGHGRR